ncbi:MAG TPA: helix-turn-helix domain-containing protein [Denitromonas sp.]|uniref:helix-turn-helix domain-containing protein n=1 Tax=Denitromonas sp. TaxID=2734609 RepID=UPI001D44B156|nr:helix-turn-helix domain-containing protein [Rhodocyclaceae bacterium]MCP5220313.1 helix-turn-helix domain-containing protein [Zoogloeaceae bacterium]HPR08468.1 helix-turn-helix domain-containing protein [Denitromonas sp.]HQU88058.1 helix-turn-helix domain-containing protein [Denitromonas sp.]HQV14233.1 helix-turn-helix domain-containing protein [Denitromonas sp.]
MYHYTGCGLPNVWLENGYEEEDTPYGKGVTIHMLPELHKTIAETIVLAKEPMTGPEFRFLRNELELSQEVLAQFIGCNKQTVARWEKSKTNVDPAAERLLRLFYQSARMGDKKLSPLLKLIQKIERERPAAKRIVATERRDNWRGKVEAEAA